MNGMAKKQQSDFSYDDTLQRIEAVAERLQSGEASFEESMKLFEEGTKLIAECQKFLDSSELIIKKVVEKSGALAEEEF